MKNAKQRTAAVSAGLIGFLVAATGYAQEAETTAEANAEANADARVGLGLPGATPAATAAARAPGGSDHDAVVGRLAVGYLGRSSVTVGAAGGGDTGQGAVAAPVIGIRYWLNRDLGLDLGLGFAYESSSSETDPGAETDGPSRWAMILHGGVPLALASSGHFVFEVVPEANIGFGGASTDAVDHSGFLLDLGARAGAEIHFGFVGLPELSLQGSVGVLFGLASASTDAGGLETSRSSVGFRTTVYDSPWNIFSSNVAALYYF